MFSYSCDTLKSLLVPWVSIPVLCCVWERTAGQCQRDVCSPAITIISQPITGLWVTSSRLARRLHCPPFSPWCWPLHSYTQWSNLKSKPYVSRDNYCLLLSSLHGFSAGFSSVYFDFSAKLNQISAEAFKKKIISPSTTPSFYAQRHTPSFLSALQLVGGICFSFYIAHSLLMRLLLLYCSPRMLEYFDYSPEYAGDYSLLFMEKAGGHNCI